MAEVMKNKIIIGSVLLLAIILIFANSTPAEQKEINKIDSKNIEKVEVIHFHGTNQCASCIAVGALAEETINTYFQDELKSGKITFAHINGELPEYYDLVMRYGVTGSSLWLGTYTKDGNFFKEENVNVWYKINDKENYLDYLKELIEKRLSGDLN